jgi:class 3 adenylate cyclase
MHHGSAVLTVHGRRIICRRVLEEGWSVTAAAVASGVSRQTASKWVNRFRDLGDAGLANRSWRGVEIDTAGDGFYATFDGPARAVRCALDITQTVRGLGVEIRAGVHTGECELIDGKPSGLSVSTGARVAAEGGPSEVLVSQTVRDLVAGSGLTFEDTGDHELKGLPDRWRLYRVVSESPQ